MERFNIEQAGLHEAKTKLTEENKSKLKQLIGKLRWVSNQSIPDVGYKELELSMAVGAPAVKEWKTANKVVRELKETNVKIKVERGQMVYLCLPGSQC